MQLTQEVTESKVALEDILGNSVNSFAYPYGAWDERCSDIVKQVGYTAACTTRTGWALRDGSPYLLRRLSIFNSDSLSVFARKLNFASHEVRWLDIAGYALPRLRHL
jgi:peptidoglycan/xylan/chitin deacetylase (PgdA/CDA1 family)